MAASDRAHERKMHARVNRWVAACQTYRLRRREALEVRAEWITDLFPLDPRAWSAFDRDPEGYLDQVAPPYEAAAEEEAT